MVVCLTAKGNKHEPVNWARKKRNPERRQRENTSMYKGLRIVEFTTDSNTSFLRPFVFAEAHRLKS